MLQQRQRQEIQAVKAGKLDVVDRRSWQWPFLPASVTRLAVPIMKNAPYNIRRMSRTPVPRRAINLTKGAIISQPWCVRAIKGVPVDDEVEQQERIKIAEKVFHHPNNQDSFQTWIEMSIEDICCLGAMATELQYTMDVERPIKMWATNIDSIRIFASWQESTPDMPRYAQMTGLKGERGAILFYDDELMYLKDNPSTDNPFGLGKVEVAFQSIADFLGVQGMSGRSGADQSHKTWLWWEQAQSEASYQIVRRHIQNELEGQAKISIIGGMKKPDVLDVRSTTAEDLLLPWQEMLIRMIANAFDLSAMALGIEHDVNRATGEVLDDKDFRSAIVPMAKRIQEGITRKVIHEKLKWYDLEFVFLNLDDPDAQTKMDLFARMYSTNAVTPNEIRQKMGMEKSDSPFSDLTQFEAMIANQEVMARIQSQMQDENFQRQVSMMMPPEPPSGELPPGEPTPGDEQPMDEGQYDDQGQGEPQQQPGGPGAAGKEKSVTAPKPIKLAKFPISGSRWTADQIAGMSAARVDRMISSGKLPDVDILYRDMRAQEGPGILEQMSDELRDFFIARMDKKKEESKSKLQPKIMKQWETDLLKLYREQQARTVDYGKWISKRGNYVRPGMGQERGGQPGNVNPVKR